jgi:recombinational DNA repair protein (RecF pathway)
MEKGEADGISALIYFFVQAADIMGIFPALDFCAVCGEQVEAADFFNMAEGGVVCGRCSGKAGTVNIDKDILLMLKTMRRVRPNAAAKYIDASRKSRYMDFLVDYLKTNGELRLKTVRFVDGI